MLKSVSSNWALTVVQILVGFAVLPFAIGKLGDDQYGTWVLISSLTSYLAILALGVPMAAVRYIAKYSTSDADEELNRTIGSCAGLYGLIGIGALIVGAVLFVVFHLFYKVTPALRTRADVAFLIVVLNVAWGFFAQLPNAIMAAHNDFVRLNVIRIGTQLLRLFLVYVFLSIEPSLIWFALVQVSTQLFSYAFTMRAVHRLYPRVRIRFSDFDWGMVKQIFSFSIFVLLLQVGTQLAFNTDSLVIGAFLPISVIPLFTVGGSLTNYLRLFITGISGVVMPTATKLDAQGAADQLRGTFLKWSKITVSLTLLSALGLMILGPPFIAWWIKPEFEGPSGAVLQILLLGNLFFLPMQGVSLPVLMGIGKPGRPAVAFLIASVVNLLLSVVLVRPLGINGVAWGTTIPNAIYALYVVVLTCGSIGVRIRDYFRYAFLLPAVGSVPMVALLLWLRDGFSVHGPLEIAAAAAAGTIVFGLTFFFVVYRHDPYVDPADWLRRAWPRRS